MFFSKALSWSLVCILLCSHCVLSARLPRGSRTERSPVPEPLRDPRPDTITLTQPLSSFAPQKDAARSIGVHIHPLTTPILPQAVGQVLIQALFTAYIQFGSKPTALSNAFHHSVSSRLPKFNVEFMMTASGNQTGEFVMTNDRIAETLSLLGFDYSNQQNVSSLVEYQFDVVIDVWKRPEVVIARGWVKNIAPDNPEPTLAPPNS